MSTSARVIDLKKVLLPTFAFPTIPMSMVFGVERPYLKVTSLIRRWNIRADLWNRRFKPNQKIRLNSRTCSFCMFHESLHPPDG